MFLQDIVKMLTRKELFAYMRRVIYLHATSYLLTCDELFTYNRHLLSPLKFSTKDPK